MGQLPSIELLLSLQVLLVFQQLELPPEHVLQWQLL